MTPRFTTRSLLCVLLLLSLCAPVLAIASPAADRDRATEFRALAAPSSAVLLTRAGARHDHARQRPSTLSVFTVVPLHSAASDPGRLAAAVERTAPRSLWTAEPRTGRSPPAIS
jgi:hypothetical protein